jgi:peptidoglycan/LPS O-acetylase OafA/YrhL
MSKDAVVIKAWNFSNPAVLSCYVYLSMVISSSTRYRTDIQVFRGLAVIAVVLFHANESIFPIGYLGVDVFFIISGLVVTPLILNIYSEESMKNGLSFSLLNFYKRRFYRLAPALAVCLAISAFAVFLIGSPDEHPKFLRQGIATLFLVGNFGAYKYSGDYFSPAPNPLVHTWSLSVEEQIYCLLPIILIGSLLNRRNIRKSASVLLTLITLISLISFLFPAILEPVYSRAGVQSSSQFSFYSPADRIWQFTLGGLIYLFATKHSEKIRSLGKFYNLLLTVGLMLILFSPLPLGVKESSLVASCLSIAVLVFKSLETLPNFIVNKLKWVGDRSYSIYLLHMPLLYLAKFSPITGIGNSENRIIPIFLAIFLSIYLGSINYTMIEKKYRESGKNNSNGIKTIALALVMTFVLPLTLFSSMAVGIKKQYWGLDRNLKQPPYAGFLDPECERDTINGPPCIYENREATKSVMLIGDSHAGMFSEAFVRAAFQTGFSPIVWTHSGCRFQLTSASDLRKHCLLINKKMITDIAERKPSAILVSQAISNDLDLKPVLDAILRLKAYSPHVSVLGNTPVFPDSNRFMKSMPILASTYVPPKEFNLNFMDSSPFEVSKEMATWSKRNGIDFLPTIPIFCDDLFCKRWNSRGWLYRDSNHLSVLGAQEAIPTLSNWMESLN